MTEPSSSSSRSSHSEIPFAAPPSDFDKKEQETATAKKTSGDLDHWNGTSIRSLDGDGNEDPSPQRRPRQQRQRQEDPPTMQCEDAAASTTIASTRIEEDSTSTTSPAIIQKPSIISAGRNTTNTNTTNTTMNKNNNTTKRRPRPRFLEYLGPIQAFPALEQARQNLNQRVPWFRDHPISADHPIQFVQAALPHHTTTLEGEDTNHNHNNKTTTTTTTKSSSFDVELAFPFWKTDSNGHKKKFGRKTVPKCLLLECCQSEHETTVLMNWWRSHTHDQQVQIQSYDPQHGLKRYYRAPNRSSSPFQYAAAAAAVKDQNKNGTTRLVLDLVKERERRVDREMRMESARALKRELGLVAEQQRTQEDGDDDNNIIPTTSTTNTTGVQEELEKETEIPSSPTPRKYHKRTKRPLVTPNVINAPLGFRAMQSTMDLMKRLDLSVDKLYCAEVVVLSKNKNNHNNNNDNHNNDTSCRLETCKYPALMNNFQFCALHKQNWWAREGTGLTNRGRGHLLLGPQYANRRTVDHIVASEGTYKRDPGACSCVDPLCHAIGWSAEMVRVPKDVALPETIRLGETKVVKGRPVVTRLAPWHFPPTTRMQLPDGSWKPLFGQKAADKFVMPTYDIAQFLKEPGMVEYQERKSLWLLPDWVYEMQAVEEGPMSLAELQRSDFRKQQKNLIRKAEMDAIVHQKLFQAHLEVTDKMDEIKKTYKKRRKPAEKLLGKKKRKVVKAVDSESMAGYAEDDSDEESDRGHGRGNESTATSTQVAEGQPPGLVSNMPYAQGGAGGLLNHPHSALTHQQAHLQAALGVHNPLLVDTTRLEDAANRAWGQHYTNGSLGRHY